MNQTITQLPLSFTLPPDFTAFIETLVSQKVAEAMPSALKTERPELLNLTEAAKYIHVVHNTLRRYIDNGEIPVSIFGGCQRIRRSDLDAFLDSRSL